VTMIPGYSWKIARKSFYVYDESAEWTWPTCLGVALSMAGALTAAYNSGWGEGWVQGCKDVLADIR
jgi:hypothetical protein